MVRKKAPVKYKQVIKSDNGVLLLYLAEGMLTKVRIFTEDILNNRRGYCCFVFKSRTQNLSFLPWETENTRERSSRIRLFTNIKDKDH